MDQHGDGFVVVAPVFEEDDYRVTDDEFEPDVPDDANDSIASAPVNNPNSTSVAQRAPQQESRSQPTQPFIPPPVKINHKVRENGTEFVGRVNGKAPLTDDKLVRHRKGALKDVGKLYSANGLECIKYRKTDEAEGVCGLPYSGKFYNGMIFMKLHGEACLLTSSNKFLARVKIDRLDELDCATTFDKARQILDSNLERVELFCDVDFENAEKSRELFEKCMDELSTNSFESAQNAGDLFQVWIILQKFKHNRKNMLEQINRNGNISARLKQIVNQYVDACSDFEKRKGMFEKLFNLFKRGEQAWFDILVNTVTKGATIHKQKALEMSPPSMKDSLAKIPQSNVFFVLSTDVKLFTDMFNALDRDIFQTILPTLTNRYCEAISKIEPKDSTIVKQLNNQIYFYLCKSLTDIVKEINARAQNDITVWYDEGEWTMGDFIQWNSHSPSLMDTCLQRELEMLIHMMHHFEPGKPSALDNFNHKFEMFTVVNPDPKLDQHNKLPTEIHVWLCLVDHTISPFFYKETMIEQLCSCLMALYKSCTESENPTMDSMESLRVITHNTIKFLARAAPFFKSSSSLDREILQHQIRTMSKATNGSQMSFLDFRDLVEVFAQYWKQRDEFAVEIAAKLSKNHFRDHVATIQNTLLKCLAEALKKNVELPLLINFCRAYEELLVDLLDLPLEWYVRSDKGETYDIIMRKGLVELVPNKWQNSEHKCYRVKNVEKFAGAYVGLSDDGVLPMHYVLETIKELLCCINNMVMKPSWKSGVQLTEPEQISSTALMIASVRSCLMYLDEQRDYIDFDKFLKENTKPFVTLSDKCASFEDFKKRVLMIKESFWYIRNLNAIDFDTALKLFRQNNQSNINEEYLRQAYNRYHEQFEIYMGSNEEKTVEEKIQHIVGEVKATVADKLTPEWDSEFKQSALPQFLAGMGAVWALHASKDVATTGQYLKPHCIQVLGVIRLLSADNDSLGVLKHLAQILTGQGKSLVLGMTAAALALCGHSVVIMCYSEYLASRDQQDFDDFYDYFSVRSKIEYKTFGEAAQEDFNRHSSNAKTHIFKCIGIPMVSDMKKVSSLRYAVLLIDEVDVFFNEEFYGKPISLGTMPSITGLDKIQMEIWRLVANKTENLRQAIDTFINNSNSKAVVDFKSLKNKPGSYMLLEHHGQGIVEKAYSNSTLFSNHINDMIKIAERVCKMADNDKFISNFRINDNGNICYKTAFGIYSDSYYCGYYNTFIYFRLKKSDFVPGKSNYGYLVLDMGCISYAKLPESYPLILGVTGTLTTLSKYEKKVVKEYYKITESSVMPSFFGASNLQYDETSNVHCFKTPIDWMNKIFSQINVIVNDKRSVLVIFDTEETINTFKQQFAAQLDRLNVLTINTKREEKDRFINDAGVSKTITLATREMGRGVDYKSSVTVEKTGGVHVIQTFFSLDVKEETQIKGRTARKDNRGSYEMILCYEDLQKLNLQIGSFESGVTYRTLSTARDELNLIKDDSRDANVQMANEKHTKTIDFYCKV